MIKVYLGKLGSGKTLCAVREMLDDFSGRKTYTNISTINVPSAVKITPADILIKRYDEKKKKDVVDVNLEFWKKQKKPLNVIWDEVHLSVASRSSMSSMNMAMSRFIAMARRITGHDKRGYGHFTFIAQTDRTIDVNIRDLTNEIRYHIGHWVVSCEDCNAKIWMDSEKIQMEKCIRCRSGNINKSGLWIEILVFSDWDSYYGFCNGIKMHKKRYAVQDASRYFGNYDTMQLGDVWVL